MRETYINYHGDSVPVPSRFDFNNNLLHSFDRSAFEIRLNVSNIIKKIESNVHLLHHLEKGDVDVESLSIIVNNANDEKQEEYLLEKKFYYDFQIANFLSEKLIKSGGQQWKILSLEQVKSFFTENETKFMKNESRKMNINVYLKCPCGKTIKIDEFSQILPGDCSPQESERELPKLPINFDKMRNSVCKDTLKKTIQRKRRFKK